MAKYQASPGAKVSGPVVVGTVDALGIYKDTGYKILADCGITDPKMEEGQFYPLQILCDFFNQVETKFGPSTLSVMGKLVAKITPVPPEVDSPEAVLSSMGAAYQLNHQNVPADEGWKYEKTGPTSARMVCNAPYPDSFCRGIIEGFVKRFKSTDVGVVKAEIDVTQPRRDKGGQSVTVLVSW